MGIGIVRISYDLLADRLVLPDKTRILQVSNGDLSNPFIIRLLVEHEDLPSTTYQEEHVLTVHYDISPDECMSWWVTNNRENMNGVQGDNVNGI